ncbi:hypothetical protein NPIL_548141 [Nephila pilipes]|uniref:Uncharacterized protein n=1 Tax=Nephila pilipes TaxID=299642 RepID=A0A8X6PQV4_NEPPI|nr:hypothetical protein NPIL_548141 [Nephila pilipes]
MDQPLPSAVEHATDFRKMTAFGIRLEEHPLPVNEGERNFFPSTPFPLPSVESIGIRFERRVKKISSHLVAEKAVSEVHLRQLI